MDTADLRILSIILVAVGFLMFITGNRFESRIGVVLYLVGLSAFIGRGMGWF